jgi:hypothetical protein
MSLRRSTSLVVLMSAVAICLNAQPVDTGAWQEARWGMSLAQTQAALKAYSLSEPFNGDVAIPESGAVARCGTAVRLSGFRMLDLPVPVTLCFGSDDRLYKVKINPTQDRGTGADVLEGLRLRFGKPSAESESNALRTVRMLDYRWHLPKTLVKFSRFFFAASGKDRGSTSFLLTYEDAERLQEAVR